MRKRKFALAGVVASVAGLLLSLVSAGVSSAHGAALMPGSRTYLCYKDGRASTGQIIPQNAACQAAFNQSGATPFYNWFAVLRSDGAGRTQGFIPDGRLCSGAAQIYNFNGFDIARADWPVTHLTSGATIQVRYNKWAHHPGRFDLYITNSSYNPSQPLRWSNLVSTPFSSVVNPPQSGATGSEEGHYYWNAQLPSGLSGRHIIYSVWTRSDSTETFYGCSDVVFDGGNGQVTF
ncbi:lytic polysaccharide monooxygenase auxiliary activity family 9 protein [Actinophytocola xinjiangensis]|uniref:lytic polysaccharide monooxygenase auxiliary activity family 9 protein n=1 Tax=Actinophytocola xinjiangensis TaxID=485602 RepID=UPI000AFB84DB|nr:lytic polysaccharide monooxygenase [Actinophytocola xinjiangensis]